MKKSAEFSPAPWTYQSSPYVVRVGDDAEAGSADGELAAFEIFDAEGNKLFDTNEDSDAVLQEANARLATAAPRLLAACRLVAERWVRGDLAEAVRLCDALVTELKSE